MVSEDVATRRRAPRRLRVASQAAPAKAVLGNRAAIAVGQDGGLPLDDRLRRTPATLATALAPARGLGPDGRLPCAGIERREAVQVGGLRDAVHLLEVGDDSRRRLRRCRRCVRRAAASVPAPWAMAPASSSWPMMAPRSPSGSEARSSSTWSRASEAAHPADGPRHRVLSLLGLVGDGLLAVEGQDRFDLRQGVEDVARARGTC